MIDHKSSMIMINKGKCVCGAVLNNDGMCSVAQRSFDEHEARADLATQTFSSVQDLSDGDDSAGS